jgi:L-malate glycosyltransferase
MNSTVEQSAAATPVPNRQQTEMRVPGAKRIRVLYIVDQLTEMGGTERLLLRMIRSLPVERFHPSIVTFKIDDRLPLFSRMPCETRVLPLQKSYDAQAFRQSLQLRRLIRTQQVDIVHTFFETADIWGGLVSRMSGAPVIVSGRRDMGILRKPKHAWAYRLVNPVFTKVLTVSEQVRKYCIDVDGLAPDRVETVYNGVDLQPPPGEDRATIREQLGFKRFGQIVLTIGNIRRVKGIDTFVRAAAEVCKQHPSALFLVVGDNHEPAHFDELQGLITNLGLTRNVIFYGPSEDVARLIAAADVFCLPSRSEGFSNALIEAMGAGLPSVATRVGGNAEAIEDGVDGSLVPPDDVSATASAISALLGNPSKARAIGKNAMETVRSRFTHDAMMDHMMRIYEGLVAETGR